MDGTVHSFDKWDLLIAHPPCTYLTNVATRSFSLAVTPADKVVDRWRKRCEAAVFFMRCMCAPVERVAVENPVGIMNTVFEPATQIIHPYQFAESIGAPDWVTKRTCLWLRGLPPLKPSDLPKPDNAVLYGRFPSGKARGWEETRVGGDRAKERSKTFPGIAKAMAEQWG